MAASKTYHPLILVDLTLHGTEARKPKPLLPELMYASGKNSPVRVFGQAERLFVTGQDEYADSARALTDQVENGEPTNEKTAKIIGVVTGGGPTPHIEEGRLGIEIRFAQNKDIAKNFKEATEQNVPFKIYVPKDGIRIQGDKNLMERINTHNRKAGKPELFSPEGRAQLYTLEILDGATGGGIIRVVLL